MGDLLMQSSMVPLLTHEQVSLSSEDAFAKFANLILANIQA
jgi:hypothetical protein